jgi:hypothetical protein
VGRDVTEQVHRVGCVSGLTREAFGRAVSQTLRVVEPPEQQTRATQCVVGPAAQDAHRLLTLEESLAFAEPVQCLARSAEASLSRGCARPAGRAR